MVILNNLVNNQFFYSNSMFIMINSQENVTAILTKQDKTT